jgi:Flp pilus assembly protein TadD
MRRVWERVGSVSSSADERPADRQAVFEAEAALTANPNSRDRHRDLVRALARVGDLERAATVAEQWLDRDQRDPEALIALADVAGRQGHRGEAVRLLSGVVDLQPDTKDLHHRLADAYERAGLLDRACSHRVAMAELDNSDEDEIAAAIRCEQSLGQHALASQLMASVTDSAAQRRLERVLSRPASPPAVNGDLMLEATWSGPQDLDLSLINSRGERISWMGGRTNVVGDSVQVPGRERLGLRWTPTGSYDLEISRTDPTDTTPVTGQIRVRLLRETQVINFTLMGTQARVGRVQVRRVARMVPM